MIAALPMYERRENAAAHDRLWAHLRDILCAGGCAAPERLTRGGDPWEVWQSGELLLSQTCGYPYRARLHGAVALVATPDHGLPGDPPGHYHSVFVARCDDARETVADFAGATLACNDALSQSGWAAPQTHAAGLGIRFGRAHFTGAHRASAQAVAAGRADIAAIDAVSWSMIREWDGFAAGLKEVGRSAATPALPYIAAAGRDVRPLRTALRRAVAALDPEDRRRLRLRGIVEIAPERYLAVPTPPGPEQEPGETPDSPA